MAKNKQQLEELQAETRDMFRVPVHELFAHPQNEEIFGSNDAGRNKDELEALISDVKMNGVQVPIIVNAIDCSTADTRRVGYTVISGHRRLAAAQAAGITDVLCDVRQITSPMYELMLLVSLNVGRGFKDAYKIRLYKGAKQFLCQLRGNPDLMRTGGQGNPEIEALVHAVHNRGLKITKGVKTWKIVEALFGFSRREQDALTYLADDEYRENLLAELGKKVTKKKLVEVRAAWQDVENKALSEDIDFRTAVRVVSRYVKEIKDLLDGKEKPVKVKAPKAEGSVPSLLTKDDFEERFGMLEEDVDEVPEGVHYDTDDNKHVVISLKGMIAVVPMEWLRAQVERFCA